MPKDKNKPKGPMSSYAAFIQVCREEHKRRSPGIPIVFAEFSKKCAERWKKMSDDEKHRFEDIAKKDKMRYNKEMATYIPPPGSAKKSGKRTKDPNAPKRNLSAFFFFCNEHRPKVKEINPKYGIGDVSKELGKMWEKETNRPKYEALAAKDKIRYQNAMKQYTGGTVGKSRGGGGSPAKKARKVEAPVEEDDDDDDEEEEESEEEESEEED